MSTALSPSRKATIAEVLHRSDYRIIGRLIEPESRVLDLGCGEAELLEWLIETKHVEGRGVEINPGKVQRAIARGVMAYQGDIEKSLPDYPDNAFDYVILSQTLQQVLHPLEVLRQMLRIGRRAVVGFPNFGHWRVRWTHLVSGRSPQTPLFPYEWYDSPNLHFLTVVDFERLIQQERWVVEKRIFVSGGSEVSMAPNLTAEIAIYVFRQA